MCVGNLPIFFVSFILSSCSCVSLPQRRALSQSRYLNEHFFLFEISCLRICRNINGYGSPSQVTTVTHVHFHGWKFSEYHIGKLYVFIPEAEDMILSLSF